MIFLRDYGPTVVMNQLLVTISTVPTRYGGITRARNGVVNEFLGGSIIKAIEITFNRF